MYDRTKFYDALRSQYGHLSAQQVEGLNFLLSAYEADPRWSDVRFVAYSLATIHRETGNTFQPIHEYGSDQYLSKYWTNPHLRSMLGNLRPEDAQNYKGRGYIQITGRANYNKFGIADDPEKALEPQTAFEIMTKGMFEGLFTGAKLGHYINAQSTDYLNARRIINGTDHAVEIAHDADMFEKILREAESAFAGVSGSAEGSQT